MGFSAVTITAFLRCNGITAILSKKGTNHYFFTCNIVTTAVEICSTCAKVY